MTSFVGRRQATAAVKRTLSAAHLVTLTGVGGTGKSRLALHVAQELRRAFADGVWLVELANVRDPSLLADTVTTALGLSDLSNRHPEAVLTGHLADKQLLLVLDNCEHMLGECGRLVARLLPAASGLRVLATSREPLGIAGEQVWPVSPLSLPPEGAAASDEWGHRYEALALFEDRAALVVPGFALNEDNMVAASRLCQRLDGLPLAIELAAVRLRELTVEEILARLVDRFRLLTTGNSAAAARHQTLRAAVEWSFDLCTELERTLWARLSVFAGEFDLAAAEEVCAGNGVLPEEVFTGVVGLVDKSLLVRVDDMGVSRYRTLETIRQYGREQLGGAKDVVVRRRHRDYYLRLAERAAADWFGPRQAEWLNHFRAEHPNLPAALDFCLTQPGEAHSGLAMAGALYWYWVVCSVRDGRQWLERTLAADTAPSRERTRAMWAVGNIAASQGDTGYARSVLEECVDLARQLDDEVALGHALQFMGMAKWFNDDLLAARTAHEQALAHYQRVGTVNSLTALALCDLATIVGSLGDTERAVALSQECIAMCEVQGEQWAGSWGRWHLAFARWGQRDLPQVITHAQDALRRKRDLHDQLGIAWCVEMLGWAAATEDDARRAAVIFGISEMLWQQVGGWLAGWDSMRALSRQYKRKLRDDLGSSAFTAAVRQGRSFTVADALAYALGEEPTAQQPTDRAEPKLTQLTRREKQVATMVAEGMSNKDIAARLVVAQRTAETHVEHILTKLGFTSRTQIAAWVADQHD